jgi:hypothetical protein
VVAVLACLPWLWGLRSRTSPSLAGRSGWAFVCGWSPPPCSPLPAGMAHHSPGGRSPLLWAAPSTRGFLGPLRAPAASLGLPAFREARLTRRCSERRGGACCFRLAFLSAVAELGSVRRLVACPSGFRGRGLGTSSVVVGFALAPGSILGGSLRLGVLRPGASPALFTFPRRQRPSFPRRQAVASWGRRLRARACLFGLPAFRGGAPNSALQRTAGWRVLFSAGFSPRRR